MFTFKLHHSLVTGDGLLYVFAYICSFYHYSIFYFVSVLRWFAYLNKFYPPFFPLQKTDLFVPKKLNKVINNFRFVVKIYTYFLIEFLIRECTYCFVFINFFTLTCYLFCSDLKLFDIFRHACRTNIKKKQIMKFHIMQLIEVPPDPWQWSLERY